MKEVQFCKVRAEQQILCPTFAWASFLGIHPFAAADFLASATVEVGFAVAVATAAVEIEGVASLVLASPKVDSAVQVVLESHLSEVAVVDIEQSPVPPQNQLDPICSVAVETTVAVADRAPHF